MTRLTYVLRFHRPAQSGGPEPPTTGPGLAAVTRLEASGVVCQFKPLDGATATLDLEYALIGDGTWFAEWGSVAFGDDAGSSLTFGSIGPGTLGPADDDGFSHGTVTYAIGSGTGQFSGATGLINSNFVVDLTTNELIDTQLGVVRLP